MTFADKVKLIQESEATKKGVRALAEQFNCGKTQVSTILKCKLEYLTAFEENGPKDRKRVCTKGSHEEMNIKVWEWFQQARAANIPISGPLLQSEKALKFAKDLDITEFKASNVFSLTNQSHAPILVHGSDWSTN